MAISDIGLIVLGIVLIVLAYFLPIPTWAKGLLYALGVISLIVGVLFLVLGITIIT